MTGYRPIMDRDKVEVNKNAKEEQGQYPFWSIRDLFNGQKRDLILVGPTWKMMDLSTPTGKAIRTTVSLLFILRLLKDSTVS